MRKWLRHRKTDIWIIKVNDIIKYSLPSVIMLIFTALYWMADWLLSSIYIWTEALSSINIIYPYICIIVAIGVMIWTWWSAIISEKLWEWNEDRARESFSQIILLTILLWWILSVITYFFAGNIVNLLWANEVLYDWSYQYLKILSLFSIAWLLQQVFQMLFITAWKAKTGLVITVFWGITNIILWYVLIRYFNMWISWAGLASGIARSLIAIYWLVYFFEKNTKLYLTRFKLRLHEICSTLENWSSEMITDVSLSIITFLFNILMIKFLWEDWVAAATIVLYIQLFVYSIFIWFSNWVAPIESFFFWEKDHKSLRILVRNNIRIIGIFSILITAILYIFWGKVISLIGRWNEDVIGIALNWWYLFYFCFLFAWINIYTSSFFTSVWNWKISWLVSILRSLVFTVMFILIFSEIMWVKGLWIAVPVAEALSAIVSILMLIRYHKKYSIEVI